MVSSHQRVTPLPLWEQTICWIIGVAGVLYGIYRHHLTSIRLKSSLRYLDDGWAVLGGKQDVGDHEWLMYSTHFCWRMLPTVALHIITSRLLGRLSLHGTVRKLAYVAVGVAALLWLLCWRYLALVMLTSLNFYLLSWLQSVPAVWAMSALYMYICNSPELLLEVLDITGSEDRFVALYLWASVYFRCTCFALERVWSLQQTRTAAKSTSSSPPPPTPPTPTPPPPAPTTATTTTKAASRAAAAGKPTNGSAKAAPSNAKEVRNRTKRRGAWGDCFEDDSRSVTGLTKRAGRAGPSDRPVRGWPVLAEVPEVLDVLVYVLYVPLLLNGPPTTFKSFKEQIENPGSVSCGQCVDVAKRFLRICFWFCFNKALLHFVFFAAVCEDASLLQDADKWTLVTTAYLMGQFMTNKYVVIYGAMAQTARLDGLELAASPVCISYIYAYSDMWRSFDRGLHSCLKRYVYIPLGGSHSSPVMTEVALLATFCTMGYWHGGGYSYMLWALLNFLGVKLEQLGAILERSPLVHRYLVSRVSAVWMRRVKAVLSYPLFLLATTSSMFFLAGPPFANIYLFQVCLQWDSFLTYGLVVYCLTQDAKHLEQLGLTKLS